MRLPVQDIGEFHNEQKAGPTPGTGLRFEETRASRPTRPKHYERSRSRRIACSLVASATACADKGAGPALGTGRP
jgi:hypothetical protein